MACPDRNKRKYLTLAAVSMGGIWAKPVVNAVVLPAHAVTSKCVDALWRIEEIFTEVGCLPDVQCHGIPIGKFIPVTPPFYPFFPVRKNNDFCVSQLELNAGAFNRDIDLDGQGPPADYIFVRYSIDYQDEFMMSGTVETADVDVFYVFKGTWSATRLV